MAGLDRPEYVCDEGHSWIVQPGYNGLATKRCPAGRCTAPIKRVGKGSRKAAS